MAANKAKAETYWKYQLGKLPVMEIHLKKENDITQCIFARYYARSDEVFITKIRLPQQTNSKKENENENEYDQEKNKLIYYKAEPIFTAKLKSWQWLLYFYNNKFQKIISYRGKFDVDVFDLVECGKLYLVRNIYDEEIQAFKLI